MTLYTLCLWIGNRWIYAGSVTVDNIEDQVKPGNTWPAQITPRGIIRVGMAVWKKSYLGRIEIQNDLVIPCHVIPNSYNIIEMLDEKKVSLERITWITVAAKPKSEFLNPDQKKPWYV